MDCPGAGWDLTLTPPFEELFCYALVGLFVITTCRKPDRRRELSRFALLAMAAWATEETCIRLYGFYGYSPGWRLVLGEVPLAVTVVWPVVILSARDLARALAPGGGPVRVAAGCAGLVFADAALIEPVAVCSGLWSWTEPGLFGVPPVGVLGWALFTGLAAAWLERSAERGVAADLALLIVVPLGTHALLLASWWGALRWVSAEIPAWGGVLGVWIVACACALLVWRRKPRVPFAVLMARFPGCLFFFALLALRGSDQPWLIAWVVGFTLPYAALSAYAERE